MLASRLRRQKSDARTGVDSEIIILFIPMTQQYFELIAKKSGIPNGMPRFRCYFAIILNNFGWKNRSRRLSCQRAY